MFHFCTSLSSFEVPNSVTSIDDNAFAYCISLKSIIISSSVTNISEGIFYNSFALCDVYCFAENVPTASLYSFYLSSCEKATLHVPATSVNAYQAAEPWNQFKEIVALTDSDPKPTGINTIETSNNEKGVIYDLHGRRVEQPTRGLYIKNSKKYVVK